MEPSHSDFAIAPASRRWLAPIRLLISSLGFASIDRPDRPFIQSTRKQLTHSYAIVGLRTRGASPLHPLPCAANTLHLPVADVPGSCLNSGALRDDPLSVGGDRFSRGPGETDQVAALGGEALPRR